MVFEIYHSGEWIDITSVWAFGTFSGTENDIDGSNAGRMSNGLMQRDYIATKMKWEFVSVPMSLDEAHSYLNLVRPETFTVRTDTVTGSVEEFTCYSNNRVLTHLVTRQSGEERYKCSFPIIEM